MVTVNKYLYEDDFGQKICPCSDAQKYKVLFREVNEIELKGSEVEAVTKASIYKIKFIFPYRRILCIFRFLLLFLLLFS